MPESCQQFKRLRGRINALNTFFGDGPLDVDFRGLGERAEKVRTVSAETEWVERFRTSSKTGQRHELSGFVGTCSFEFPSSVSEVSNLELLKWIALGELVHVGKHRAWGMGGTSCRALPLLLLAAYNPVINCAFKESPLYDG